jgi:hypothetical protein
MGNCGSCKHWLTNSMRWDTEPLPPNLMDEDGEDTDTPAPGKWGYCEKAGFLGPKTNSKFYVRDASQYVAKLGTREDFGCVEHEAIA